MNNMLIVGDVHYYIISAQDINAIDPLPAVRSSSSSVSSHSSRMSRCSKLAAQVIASQLVSARSSPILGSDMSLFSRSSDIESPVPMMETSIRESDQEGSISQSLNGSKTRPTGPDQGDMSSRLRRGSLGSVMSNQSFQPGRPSRLRQAVKQPGIDSGNNDNMASDPVDIQHHGALDTGDAMYSPSSSHLQQQGQSPLFQNLMNGSMRNRSNTVSSVTSDKSASSVASSVMSDKSDQSHSTNRSIVTSVSCAKSNCSNSAIFSPSISSVASPVATSPIESVVYTFRYLASDDDFLLRSAIRQIFKANALETWDAILFTISNGALREYSGPEEEQVHQQSPSSSRLTPQTPAQDIETPTLEAPRDDASSGQLATEMMDDNPASSLQTGDSTLPQNGDSSEVGNRAATGDSQSMPSLLSAPNTLTPATAPLSFPSSFMPLFSPEPSSSLSSSDMLTTTTSRTRAMPAKHDSGHTFSTSLPLSAGITSSIEAGNSGSSNPRVGLAGTRRPTSGPANSVSDGDLPLHLHTDAQRKSSGRKIRQALSKLFAM